MDVSSVQKSQTTKGSSKKLRELALSNEFYNASIRGAFKLEEARQYLGGISVPSMHRLIKRGLLKPSRNLRHHIFSKAELDRFLSSGQ